MKIKNLWFLVISASLFLTSCFPISDSPIIMPLKPSKQSLAVSKPKIVVKSLSIEQSLVKAKIRAYFADLPVMVRIAGCESSFAQFDSDGDPLVSKTNDVGVLQINLDIWGTKASKKGLDIKNSIDDNMEMARYVYEQQGLKAWTCAKML